MAWISQFFSYITGNDAEQPEQSTTETSPPNDKSNSNSASVSEDTTDIYFSYFITSIYRFPKYKKKTLRLELNQKSVND